MSGRLVHASAALLLALAPTAARGQASGAAADAPAATSDTPAATVTAALAATGDAPVSTARAQVNSSETWVWRATADEAYRFRQASERTDAAPLGEADELALEPLDAETDQDLRLMLWGDVSDRFEHYSAEASLALWLDVDGVPTAGEPSGFASIHDDEAWLDVYTLAAAYRGRNALRLARLGRQSAEHGRAATFDGADVELQAVDRRLVLFAFGGRTVHFYEVDAALFEDWLASGGVTYRPWDALRLEADYRFLREDTTAAEGLTQHDYGLSAWYRGGDWLQVNGRLRGIDEKLAKIGADVGLGDPAGPYGVRFRADVQPRTLRELAEQDDPFFSILGESNPHARLAADAWRRFDTAVATITAHVGWNGRLLLGGEPGPFNRDVGRAYAQLEAHDIGIRGPFVAATGEYHYTHQAAGEDDDGLFAVGGAAGYDAGGYRAEVATDYQRYKYTYYRQVDEVASVRSVSASGDVRLTEWLRARARYVHEQIPDRAVHTVTVALKQVF